MKRIACFIPNLHGGGAERAAVNMLQAMLEEKLALDLVLANAEGPYLSQVPEQVRIINFGSGRVLKSILPLVNYLQITKPNVLISYMSDANVAAVLAKKLSGTNTKLILVEQNTLSASKSKLFRGRFVPLFMKWLYPQANAIVGISQGVAKDLELQLSLPKCSVRVIYNPIVSNTLIHQATIPFEHPWFHSGNIPIFLAVGRLTEQKDFPTLIKAFALLRKQRLARLLILGEGEQRGELEQIINQLGISEDVSLPGFVNNPYAYMHKSSAFVLSSRWEGLANVLIEAMACGCPVISTDCPYGPGEILDAGKYGSLVPIGDAVALSQAMMQVLNHRVNRDMLIERAMYFSVERAASEYLALSESL